MMEMSLVVDARGDLWEEQSPGVFCRLFYLPATSCVSCSMDIDLILTREGTVLYRDVGESRIFKPVKSNESFVWIASNYVLTDNGNLYQVTIEGRLLGTNLSNLHWIGMGRIDDKPVLLMVDRSGNGSVLYYDRSVESVLNDCSKMITYQNLIYRVNSNGIIEGLKLSGDDGSPITYDRVGIDLYGNTIIINSMDKIVSHRRLLLIQADGVSFSHHQELIPTNIPPERFLPNLNPDKYRDYRLGVVITNPNDNVTTLINPLTKGDANLRIGHRVVRVILDRIALITWKNGDLHIDRPFIKYNNKPIYHPEDVSALLCEGIELALSIGSNSQLINDATYNRLISGMEFLHDPIDYITSQIVIEAASQVRSASYRMLSIPSNCRPVIYRADGEGREIIFSYYGDVLDYRYTPSRAYPAVTARGFLHGRDIYSDTEFYSISYRYNPLTYQTYHPDIPPPSYTLGDVIYLQINGKSLVRSFSGQAYVYIQEGKIFGHGGVRIMSHLIVDDQLSGFYRVQIFNGRISNPIQEVGPLILPKDAARLNDNFYNNYPNPFDLADTVITYIKIQHRSIVTSLFKRIRSEPYRDVGDPLLLDLGAGVGGDIRRWNSFYNRVVAVEPNQNNYKELLSRISSLYDECRRSNQFCVAIRPVNAQAQEWEKIEPAIRQLILSDQPVVGSVTVIAMIDVLTFFSREDLNQLARTITTALNPEKGMLIFKVMDGDSVVRLLSEHGSEDDQGRMSWRYGDFSITRVSEHQVEVSNKGIVGQGQLEYLFYPDQLRQALKSMNMNTNYYSKIPIRNSDLVEISLINDLYRTGIWFTRPSRNHSQYRKNYRKRGSDRKT